MKISEEPKTKLDKWIEKVYTKFPSVDYELLMDETEELLKTKPDTISEHNAEMIIHAHFESWFGYQLAHHSLLREGIKHKRKQDTCEHKWASIGFDRKQCLKCGKYKFGDE